MNFNLKKKIITLKKKSIIYENKEYIVSVMQSEKIKTFKGFPEILHVTIIKKNHNKITNWNTIQKIKDIIIGKEYTAIQIFPPTSEIIDYSNAYHLWVFNNKNFKLPFGLGINKRNIKNLKK